jgi:hypothetical protein
VFKYREALPTNPDPGQVDYMCQQALRVAELVDVDAEWMALLRRLFEG